MGFFGNSEKKVNKELEEARIYVETIRVGSEEQLDIEIAKRIKSGRIIKDVKFVRNGTLFNAMILYDPWAEKARDEKKAKDRG